MPKPKTNSEWIYEIVTEIKEDLKELKTRFYGFIDNRGETCPLRKSYQRAIATLAALAALASIVAIIKSFV